MELSIVIPAYNEEQRIGKTLDAIQRYAKRKQIDLELVVVDDGSSDNTTTIAIEKGATVIQSEKNHGKGFAVRTGMLQAKKKWILTTDSDLSTPIKDIQKLYNHTGDVDIVIGSRNLPESNIPVPQHPYRKFLGKSFPICVKLITHLHFRDTQCGFKLFSRRAARAVAKRQTIQGFAFDVEQLVIAHELGFKIKEVGVTWKNAEGSKVNPTKHVPEMLKDLLKIRARSLQGKYR